MVSGVGKNTQLNKLDGLIKQHLQILMMMQQGDKFKASLGINQFPWLDIGLIQGKSRQISRKIIYQKVPQITVIYCDNWGEI